MAKIQEIFSIIDELKPNVFSENIKLKWLNTIEGRIALEIHKETEFIPYVLPDDSDTNLLVSAPYDNLYEYYIKAMIDNESNNVESYNNNISLFNSAYSDYSKYYIRNNPDTNSSTFSNIW